MEKLASGWSVETDRGPDWLFVRLHAPDEIPVTNLDLADQPLADQLLADQLWTLLERHLTYRLVIELDGLTVLRSSIIGELIVLHKRIQQHGGLMRLCGLSKQTQQAIRTMQLESWLPQYKDREAALMGMRPPQPR